MPPKGSDDLPGAPGAAPGPAAAGGEPVRNDAGGGTSASSDPQLEAALRAVLDIVFRQHPLLGNQILHLAAELQRLGTHRVVEEHIARHRRVETQRGEGRDAPKEG